jgi:predicted ATPase/DNA-binding SARP family transcriptional activator
LGVFDANLGEQPVTGFESDKVRALLAYLAVESGRAHSRKKLADLLWPASTETAGRRSLNQALSNLRRVIGDRNADPPFLLITRHTLQLNRSSDHWLDTVAFSDLLDRCRGHRDDRGALSDARMRALQQALALCRGSFLEGFSVAGSPEFEEWSLVARERLRRLEVEVCQRLAACHERRGDYTRAAALLRRWLVLEPWDEEGHRQLMRALWQSGRHTAALHQYNECQRILAEQFGVPPSADTTVLYDRIRAGPPDHAALSVDTSASSCAVPIQRIPLVGRRRELREIAERLADRHCRLLTLTGPGGCGKTRLAIEAAKACAADFDHGVRFVSLAGLQSTESIVPAIAEAVGVGFHGGGDPEEQLLGYLRHRSILLIADNCEHLLDRAPAGNLSAKHAQIAEDGGLAVLARLLDSASEVKLLATSRAPLRLLREHLYFVSGMGYPQAEAYGGPEATDPARFRYGAVQLFVQRAQKADSRFMLDSHNAGDVARLCQAVAGMPLAILLAAPWVRMLSPGEIVRQLQSGVDVLETDLRQLPERQRSMRAVFDHSWVLLTEREQDVMEALSVFRGSFTPRAARAVARASLHELRALVDRSLIQPAGRDSFQIHELMRHYAEEKLAAVPGARDAVRDRHAAYYAAILDAWEGESRGPQQREALRAMDAEIDNARAAWDWAVEQVNVAHLAQAASGLHTYYARRLRIREGEAAFRAAAEHLRAAEQVASDAPGSRRVVLARVVGFYSRFAMNLNRDDQVVLDLVAEGIKTADEAKACGLDARAEEAYLWCVQGMMEFYNGWPQARESLERSLALLREMGNLCGVADVLVCLSLVDGRAGRFGEVREVLAESAAIYRGLGNAAGLAESTLRLGSVCAAEGRLEEAARLARDGLAMGRRLSDPDLVAFGLALQSGVAALTGDYQASLTLREQSMAIRRELGLRDDCGQRHDVGRVEVELGRYDRAREDLQRALEDAHDINAPGVKGCAWLDLGRLEVRAGRLSDARILLRKSIEALEAFGSRQGALEARCALVYVAQEPRDLERARHDIVGLLRSAVGSGSLAARAWALPAAAMLLLKHGEVERAVEIYGLACTLPAVANSQWVFDVVGQPIAHAAAALPPEVLAAAQACGRRRDVQATVEELIGEWAPAPP